MIHKILKAKNLKNKIEFFDLESLENVLMKLPDEVEVVLRKESKLRSLRQNRYYWAVVISELSAELGHSEDEMHEIFKTMFLTNEVDLVTKSGNKHFNITKSTTELTTAKMEVYLEKIRQFADLELGIYLPLPNEVDF